MSWDRGYSFSAVSYSKNTDKREKLTKVQMRPDNDYRQKAFPKTDGFVLQRKHTDDFTTCQFFKVKLRLFHWIWMICLLAS